jgi:hypothetical protein
MGSYSSTVAKDQRLAVSGDAGQVTSPQSQIANPLGFALGASDSANLSANLSFGDVRYNDLDQVNALVTSIMLQNTNLLTAIAEENSKTLEAISKQTSSVTESFGSLGTGVLDSVTTAANEIKEPLTKYIPIAVILIFIAVMVKMGPK